MADKTFSCTLITPAARVLDAEVTYASVPMHDGQMGVMHQTGAIVGKLGPGALRLDFPGSGSARSWFIEGGFMQNVSDRLTILASGATPVDEIDREETRAALAEAEARKATSAEEMDKLTAERTKLRRKIAAAG
jgi:F0F1-type ATP synthase epsilon subunit